MRRVLLDLLLLVGLNSFQSAKITVSLEKQKLLNIFNGQSLVDNIYACPESLQPLDLVTRFYGFYKDSYFLDRRFGAKYKVSGGYADFTLKVNENRDILGLSGKGKPGQIIFQNPIMSAVYERGYRQSFERAGFPGIQKEYEEALSFFVNTNNTDIVLDLSAGSGFMTRKFIKSGMFRRVIAADLSLAMLQQTKMNCLSENLILPELIRCDSAKLPILSGSINSIHAGAAMHCWPEISLSLAEIYRVLKPGGTFFATTFIQRTKLLNQQASQQGFTFFESEDAIKDLLNSAGFSKSEESGDSIVRREGAQCVVVRAMKSPVDEAKLFTNSAQ